MTRKSEIDALSRLVAKELSKTGLRTEHREFVPISRAKEVVDAVFNAVFKRLSESDSTLIDGFFRIYKFKVKGGGYSYYIKTDAKKKD